MDARGAALTRAPAGARYTAGDPGRGPLDQVAQHTIDWFRLHLRADG